MTLPLMITLPRRLVFLSVLAATLPLAADEIQQLPDMAVTGSAGLRSTQPTVLAPAVTADPSAGLADTARYSAGFAINDAGARGFGTTSTLRGLGNTPYFSDASAPVYLDDIPLASAFTFPTELYDFGSVAIHRGPQANTLFGQAGDAGVIQLLSAPAPSAPAGRVALTLGNHGLASLTTSVAGAASDHADATAAISASRRDGYIHNTTLNQDVDDRQSLGGRVRVRYHVTPDLEVSVHVLGQHSIDGAQPLVPLGGPYDSVARGKEGRSDTVFGAAALGVTRKLADGTLSATSSYSDWQLSPYRNRLVVFGGANFDSAVSQSQHTFAEEVKFATDRYSGGAYYATSRTKGATDRLFSGFPVERSGFTTDADTLALFGRATFAPAEGWGITPGLRVERTAKDFVRTETVPRTAIYHRDNDWSAFLPSVSATRRLDATSDLTLTLARGFKPGGYSAYTGRADLTEFEAQRTWGLEAAYSTSPRDSHFTYTARAYAYRVRGYQIERSFAVPNSFTDEYLVVNADRARMLGFELESVWRPATDLSVTLAASVARATLERFTDPFTGTSYSGNQAPYAPAGNGALRFDYHPAAGFFAGAGLTWTGTTYYDEQETAMFAQRSYTLIEAQAGYTFPLGEIRLFGRNLGDKEYYSAITPGVGHATPGAPLTWGGELALRW